MFLVEVKSRIVILLALGVLLVGVPSTAAAATKPPTLQQMRAAAAKAERSTDLWATVNICNTAKYPDTIGIRGQMPALGFAATLQMQITLDYYSLATASLKPVPKAHMLVSLGTVTSGDYQDGVTFKVKPPAILSGTIKFFWRSGTTLLGSAIKHASGGEKGVDQSDPGGFSAATCRMS